ncbi:ATP-binding protein [Kitasatospora terrestris]|uniref:Histidine kinase/HSP90-like ATPase domain-containing protein n=1 Tax=Kitasatospora terrestris TaxID=258051 RepID=A0ABP9ENG8_9ACTN
MRTLPVTPVVPARLAFPAGPAPVSEGIAFTRRALTTWFPRTKSAAVADIVLVAAELLANAAQHADGPLALDLRTTPSGRIRIAVTDASAAVPKVRSPMPHTPGGHGMRIVDHLARAWGTHPAAGGKTVWAECDPPPTTIPAL